MPGDRCLGAGVVWLKGTCAMLTTPQQLAWRGIYILFRSVTINDGVMSNALNAITNGYMQVERDSAVSKLREDGGTRP